MTRCAGVRGPANCRGLANSPHFRTAFSQLFRHSGMHLAPDTSPGRERRLDSLRRLLSVERERGSTARQAGRGGSGSRAGFYASPNRSKSALGSGSRPMKPRYNSAGSWLSPRERIFSRNCPPTSRLKMPRSPRFKFAVKSPGNGSPTVY